MKQHYITAVSELILQGMDITDVFEKLSKTLKESGHIALHSQILRGVLSKIEQAQKSTRTSIVVAEEADVQKLQQTITTSLQKIGGSLENAIIIRDKTIGGGYIATHNGVSIDASYKGTLVQLYRNITA